MTKEARIAAGLALALGALALSVQAGRYGPRPTDAPIHRAAGRGDLAEVRRLLDAGTQPDLRTYGGTTPLGLALAASKWPVAELLLARGADPNATVYSMPLLRCMALSDHSEAYRWLLAHGARPDAEAARLLRSR